MWRNHAEIYETMRSPESEEYGSGPHLDRTDSVATTRASTAVSQGSSVRKGRGDIFDGGRDVLMGNSKFRSKGGLAVLDRSYCERSHSCPKIEGRYSEDCDADTDAGSRASCRDLSPTSKQCSDDFCFPNGYSKEQLSASAPFVENECGLVTGVSVDVEGLQYADAPNVPLSRIFSLLNRCCNRSDKLRNVQSNNEVFIQLVPRSLVDELKAAQESVHYED